MAVEPLPDFLTVEEAAAILRIGRTAAFQQARLFLATGGAEGLPVRRVGHAMRVPTARLEEWAGRPLSWPCPKTGPELPAVEPLKAVEAGRQRRRRRPSSGLGGALPLFEIEGSA